MMYTIFFCILALILLALLLSKLNKNCNKVRKTMSSQDNRGCWATGLPFVPLEGGTCEESSDLCCSEKAIAYVDQPVGIKDTLCKCVN